MSWPWSELGLSGPADLKTIRGAYAQRLKATHPEEDPEGFQRLHDAYQEASRRARQAARAAAPSPPPAPELEEPKKPEETGRRNCGEPPYGEPKPPEKPEETGEQAWDYDELLEEKPSEPEQEPEKPEEESAGWDYERLFAEGEAEAQATRRRKLEELREKNRARYAKQEKEQRRRAREDEEAWAAVMAASHALELLHASGAPAAQWRRFLESPVFLSVRANLDFVFALEDFLEQRPDLSPEIRRAVFEAYESCNASKYPVYNRLYKLLNVERKDKRRMARAKSGWRARWRSFPTWRKICAVASLVVLGVCLLIIFGLSDGYEPPVKEPDVPWTEQAPEWLEADYGEPFVHAASEYIFAPAAEPDLYFWAVRNSKRSAGWPGYLTNYPYVRVRQALEAFAQERGLDLDLGSYTHEIGEAPKDYLLNLPLQGAEEDVAALGALIEDLAAQPWHQLPAAQRRTQQGISAPAYNVYLCHKGLAFYHGYAPETFDAEEALALYAQAGPAFCRYLVEQTGLADRHMGPDAWALEDRETLEIGGSVFFQVAGLDKETGEVRVRYLMGGEGSMLFCLPEDRWHDGLTMPDIYRGSCTTAQLEKVGHVLIMDQVK